jgi:hypothetical protein
MAVRIASTKFSGSAADTALRVNTRIKSTPHTLTRCSTFSTAVNHVCNSAARLHIIHVVVVDRQDATQIPARYSSATRLKASCATHNDDRAPKWSYTPALQPHIAPVKLKTVHVPLTRVRAGQHKRGNLRHQHIKAFGVLLFGTPSTWQLPTS